MSTIFNSGSPFTSQKPQLSLNLSGAGGGLGGGTGLFSQKPTGTTGLGGATPFSGLAVPAGRGGPSVLGGLGGTSGFGGALGSRGTSGGSGIGLGGMSGVGGLGGMSGAGGLGGMSGTGGLGGMSGTGGLGGMSDAGGLGGMSGAGGLGMSGVGGLGGMSGAGGLGGMSGTGGLGGMSGAGGLGMSGVGGLGGMSGAGGLGGMSGTGGLGGMSGVGGLGGMSGAYGLGGMSGAGGLGGMSGTGGLGGMSGTGGLGGMSGTGGLGGMGGAYGLGGMSGVGGMGGMSGVGGLGGMSGTGGLGGMSGVGGLGGMSGTGGLGGMGGAYGLGTMSGVGGMGGMSGVGGLTGLGRGTPGTGLSGGLWGPQGQAGVGAGMGLSGALGGGSTGLTGGLTRGGLSGTSGMFTSKPQGGVFYPGMSGAPRAQTHEEQMQLTAMALSSPTIFGDERDNVLHKLNQLQVYWGFGKGICNSMGIMVEFTETNPFFVMKSVGYLRLPTNEDSDGLVRIIVNKTENELKSQKTNICNTLRQIINDQSVNPTIDSIYGIIETNLSEIRFYLLDGSKNRISAKLVIAFFSTNDMTNKLRNMGVQELHPCLRPSAAAVKAYLEKTPQGFDSNVWSQAVRNNPNPKDLVPVPILGFQALRARALAQKSQSEQHESRLKLIGNEITNLQLSQTNIVSKFEQAKRKQLELNHRILKVMVQQEISRKSGHTIQEDEEILRVQFESILSELTSPTGVKSELAEMASLMRLNLTSVNSKEDNYKLETDVVVGIQMHLSDQQERIENLLKVITEDMEDLKVIQEALVDGSL